MSEIAPADQHSHARHAAFWRLPAELTPGQRARLAEATVELNAKEHSASVEHLRVPAMIARANALATGPDAIDSPLRFLALARLARTKAFQHHSPFRYNSPAKPAVPAPSWFEMDKASPHLGLECLRQRKGTAAKSMLVAGCHPALLFSSRWDATCLPSPKQAAAALISLAANSSIDACKTLFNALDASCADPALFRAEFAEAARVALRGVWVEREGVANASEEIAVAQCAFAFERLAKKKALPADLVAASAAVTAKRASFSGQAEGAAFEFTPLQTKRMKALAALYAIDDLQGFAALAPLCGLDRPEAFEAGAPAVAALEWPAGKYWGTKLSYQSAFCCAAHIFDLGENPWLCAGDGQHGVTAEGNPFTWLIAHARAGEAAGFSTFASAVARSALRDAETRQPGNGLASCLEAFDSARARRPALWAQPGPGAAIVLAACEQALFPSMMAADSLAAPEDGARASAPATSRPPRL